MTKKYNIILLQGEDVGRHLGCYGDSYAETPNLDQLASEGALYTNAFSHAPVCAPSRGGMVSGCYPWSLGNHYMRCTLVNPPQLFTHELIKAGYHVSWPTKTDFNFEPTEDWTTDFQPWWENSPPTEPFFLYRNFGETHESRMFAQVPDWHAQDVDLPDHLKHDPKKAPIPPYLPDTKELRDQLVKYYDAFTSIDESIGNCLKWIDDNGLRENTIVIFLSDHGRGLPREKRWCYDAGIHLPLIIRWPGKIAPGTVDEDMVAWVDIAPTILSTAGISPPENYQGQIFLGPQKAKSREYIFAGRDRMDEVFDKVRIARSSEWHYIRNDAPGLPYAQKQSYMEEQPAVPVMRKLNAESKLSGDEAVFFQLQKPAEELYHVPTDPHHLHNLAGDAKHIDILRKMRNALESHLKWVGDLGEVDESLLIEQKVVTDRLPEFRARLEAPDLPSDQIIGPRPIPVTLNEAKPWLAGSAK